MKNKNIFLLLLFCAALVSCNIKPKNKKHLEKSQVISKKPHGEIDSITNVKANNGSPSITPLPFGSDYLGDYKNPKAWTIDSNDHFNDPRAEEFLTYYINLQKVKSVNFHQSITSIQNITLGNDSILFIKKSKLSYRYLLPDFGPYKCYYQTISNSINDGNNDDEYTEEGYLLFYNKRKQQMKIVNVFSLLSTEACTFVRCFFISKDKHIEIFEAQSFDSQGSIKKTNEINIAANGSFLIKNF